jgi:integrase/recombinase XerC
MLKDFISYIKLEKRYSNHTVVAYEKDLLEFEEFLSFQWETELIKANFQSVRAWVLSLMESGSSPRTVNRKISSLRSFFKFQLRKGNIKLNPLSKITPPKQRKDLPQFFSEKEMVNLSSIEFENNYEGVRDKLILELFYCTGIRRQELIDLKSVNVSFNEIKVLGKRNKERIIPLSHNLTDLLVQYKSLRKEEFGEVQDEFFLTSRGKKLYPKLVYQIVNRYIRPITTVKKVSPHVLRHSFATHMLNNGADLNAIKEILGHSNLSATQVYTHNSVEKLKNVHKLAHPRGQ